MIEYNYKIYEVGDVIVNEYLLTVKTIDKNKLYKVYAPNKKVAINKFINMCVMYQDSKNPDNREHWEQQNKAISDNNYSILKIEDFCGVRSV